MRLKRLLFAVSFAAMILVAGCGTTGAPSSTAITVFPTTVTLKDNVDVCVDQYIMTLVQRTNVMGTNGVSSSVPMQGVKVQYDATFTLTNGGNNNTPDIIFLDKNGNPTTSPYTDLTDANGISTLHVRLMTGGYYATPGSPLQVPYINCTIPTGQGVSTTTLSYKDNVDVSSGSATSVLVPVSVK
ncbi:MAG: hypothetical protein M1517_04205 [Deltaproteobacteria bacterium]|nr:hypothetical protein [Deltaproteobacteria bacterium]